MAERKLPANHEMATKVQRFIAVAVVALTTVVIAPAITVIGIIVNDGKPIQPGKEAPLFTLPNQNSTNITIKDYLGQWCLIYFYNEKRSDALVQAKYFRENYENLQELELQLIGISYDSVPSHYLFSKKLDITHPLLSGPEGHVIEAYSADSSMNHMARNLSYLIDADGIVKKVYIDLLPEENLHAVRQDLYHLRH